MTLETFIKQTFNTEEKLPFDAPVVHYKKGEEISRLGVIETNIYFVVSGVVESYMPACNSNQQDNIIEFTFENSFVTSLSSLLKQKPSETYTCCLTNCTVQVIPYAQLMEAFESSILVNKFYRKFIEEYYFERMEKAKDMLTKTADQRYIELIKNKPHVIREIPLGHIAKYIGVHPNSLSRIRRKIFSSKRFFAERELEAA